jgi:hypothetical protein
MELVLDKFSYLILLTFTLVNIPTALLSYIHGYTN